MPPGWKPRQIGMGPMHNTSETMRREAPGLISNQQNAGLSGWSAVSMPEGVYNAPGFKGDEVLP
eukprot:8065643-Ditylum_brightwellii.AAC.1